MRYNCLAELIVLFAHCFDNKKKKRGEWDTVTENPKTKDNILDVYEDIKSKIIRREISTDVKINQNQIAKELCVSRTPVIKALHMLKTEGLVDNIPNKGFYVHKHSLKDTVELYELRQAVEMVASANTAIYATMHDIEQLREIFKPFIGAKEISVDEYEAADIVFHSRLIELSQNSILQRTNQSILILPKAFTSGLLRKPQETLQEHIDIIEALMRRDGRQAQMLAQKHLELGLNMLRGVMNGLTKIGIDPQKISVTDAVVNLFNSSQ